MSKRILVEVVSVPVVAALLQYCKTSEPATEEERQIRTLFEQLARELPGAKPEVITPYLTESAHHEAEGPYHHRAVLESLMEFSTMEELRLELTSVMVGNNRAFVRCRVSASPPSSSGSEDVVEKERMFELRLEPPGWRIADHRLR